MKLQLILIIIFISWGSNKLYSQSGAYEIYYTLTLQPDSTSKDSIQELFVNVVDQGKSYFSSLEERQKDSVFREAFHRTGSIAAKQKPKSPYSKLMYVVDSREKKMYYQTSVVDKVTIAQPFPNVMWTPVDSIERHGNFICQLATGTIGGRNYNVWFTTDIPVTVGPWKFNNLPGMVVVAEDISGRIRFDFAGIKEIKPNTVGLNLKKYPLVSWKDYRAAANMYNEDPLSFIEKRSGIKGSFSRDSKTDNRRKTDILSFPDNFNYLLEINEKFL